MPSQPALTGRPCGLALGSNLGDRVRRLKTVIARLEDQFGPLARSRFYETMPVDCPAGSGMYVNAAVEITTDWSPQRLLKWCLALENELGRVRSGQYGEARTIDIDLLYMGELQCNTPRLALPHPRAHLRRFVLRPLADIRPGLVLPGQTDNVASLLLLLPEGEPEPTPLSPSVL